MKTIRALRQFSHYHAGNFDQYESRPVTDDIAEALVGMDLAELVEAEDDGDPKKTAKKGAK
ncbi:hypothetical protein [Pseudomonas petrae]|uniref:Uncharacterized protein n=1 Tax=Pseudomonas petrae TaxID=2912190 RepID=A0ABS9ICV0_9PSED|nr:hypothetical protein [Pseudomonas petrae]MCF7545558.1 hypothetical protein [Pseudomonas petrae]